MSTNSNADIHSADIVVNASGRADKFYTWLKARGARSPNNAMMRKSVLQDTTLRDGVDEPERDSDNPSALIYLSKIRSFPGR